MATKDKDKAAPVTRDDMRTMLLGKKHKPDSVNKPLFGMEIELRQASLSDVLDSQTSDDTKTNAANMIIQYSFVPGTDERIFEEGDRTSILGWPMTPELMAIQEAIAELTGVDVDAAMEALNKNPLKES